MKKKLFHILPLLFTLLMLINMAPAMGQQVKSKVERSSHVIETESSDFLEETATLTALSENELLENQKSASWYRSQAATWQGYTDDYPGNPVAWQNYYLTSKISSFEANTNTLSSGSETKLNTIVDQMEVNVPNSYQYHYIKHISAPEEDKDIIHLKTAEHLAPSDKKNEVYDDLVIHHWANGNKAEVKNYATKLMDTKTYSPASVEYCSNVLNSVPKNGVLLSYGKLDTEPLMMLQGAADLRTDVAVVSLDLLNRSDYRAQVKAQFNLTLPSVDPNDELTYVKSFKDLNSKSNIYLTNTFSSAVLKPLKTQLSVCGLVFGYNNASDEPSKITTELWEGDIRKNYLTVKPVSNNYLMPLLELHKWYKTSGQTLKQIEVDSFIKTIIKGSKNEQRILDLLK